MVFVECAAAFGRLRLRRACAAGFALLLCAGTPSAIFAGGGSAANPDLQVGGFAVFGTNVAGATAVTSGWGNAYLDGSMQVRSNLHVGGTIASTGLVQVLRHGFTQRDQWLVAGATIQPSGSYLRVRGDVAPVVLGNPQIAPGVPGQLLTLQGVSNPLKVTLVDGSGLRMKLRQSFSLGEYDTIQFIYDDSTSIWVEINRSQNRWDN